MVTISQVNEVLLPWLGSSLLKSLKPYCEDWTELLNSPRIYKEPHEVYSSLSAFIFRAVKLLTQNTFTVKPDGYRPVKMNAEDFDIIADELMFAFFMSLPLEPPSLFFVQRYALQYPSLGALRALYERFSIMQTPEEIEAIRKMITSHYPKNRYAHWLN